MQFSREHLRAEAKSFHLKKRLGQHFLISPDALQCIVESLQATAGDTIIEVGAGLGFLTRPLSVAGARVIAVDLDRESIVRLDEMHLPGVELKHGDFLQFDLNSLEFFSAAAAQETSSKQALSRAARLKVAGNVPYQITGLILGHILGEIDRPSAWLEHIKLVVLTVQKEVAERMVASAGSPNYSKLSLLIEHYCKAELVMQLDGDMFFPPPKVSSAIVRLTPRLQPAVKPANIRLLKKIIDAGFRQRRKTLPNALSFLRIPAHDLQTMFKNLKFDPQTRAERLSLQQFAMLADTVDEYLTTHAHNSSASPSES